VFGPFFVLPLPLQPLPSTSYDALSVDLSVTTAKVQGSLREWNSLANIGASGFNIDINSARCHADQLPSPLRPLVSFLLTRRYAWERAKLSASEVMGVIARLAINARAALRINAATAEFWDAEAQKATVGDAEHDTLRKSHIRLFKGAVELCWIYNELLEFEKLSTQWFHRLPTTWLEDDDNLLGNGPALYAMVTPLVEWANAAHRLDESLRGERRKMWRPIAKPFEARHNSPLWYRFGNPRSDEMPQGFDGTLNSTFNNYIIF
jgi:hypothetical protein